MQIHTHYESIIPTDVTDYSDSVIIVITYNKKVYSMEYECM